DKAIVARAPVRPAGNGADAAIPPSPKPETPTKPQLTKSPASTAVPPVPARREPAARPERPQPPPVQVSRFQSIFNGKDLTGWKVAGGEPRHWRFEDQALVVKVLNPRVRDYLLSTRDYADFTLRFEYRVEPGGSG